LRFILPQRPPHRRVPPYSGASAICNLQFAKTLPPETWAPTKEEEADTLIVPPARYDQLMRAMFGERAAAAKKKLSKPER
jgi:hypothetical protein